MSSRTHHRPGRAGCVRAPRTPLRLDGRAARAEWREMLAATDAGLSSASYHRCHGETRVGGRPRRLKSVLEASVRITVRRPWRRMQCDLDRLCRAIWSDRSSRPRRRLAPKRRRSELPGVQLITYRTAGPLREHGNLEPSAEREDVRQAAKPGDVSVEGRSLRSSPSAGKPRTWRREAVDRTAAESAGKAMYVASEDVRLRLRSKRRDRTREGVESWTVRIDVSPRGLTRSPRPGSSGASPLPSRQHRGRARCVSKGARRVR